MKAFFKLRVGTAIVLLLTCLVSIAADPPKPAKADAKPKSAADASKATDPWQRRLPEFQADNLPLSEVASFLSDQFPEINFVLHPAVKDTPVSLRLRSVTLDDIFTALDIGTQSAGHQVVDPMTGLASQGAVQANKLNDRMVSFTYRQTPLPEATKPVCRAFSLSRHLAGKSDKEADNVLNEIEDALKLCWAMLQDADRANTKTEQPQLNLHRGTKLLIVVGQPSQVEVVEQVINQVEGGSGSPVAIDPSTGLPGGSEVNRAFLERYGVRPSSSVSTNPPPGRR